MSASVPAPVSPLSLDELQSAVPKHLRKSVTQSLVDKMNALQTDPEVAQEYRENVVTYTSVLQQGRYTVSKYLLAVQYCTLKFLGHSNRDAYARTFPARLARLVAAGKPEKDIAAYVAAYHKGKLVQGIMEQAQIPIYVLNQHHVQAAVNVLVDIMGDPKQSGKVRTEAASAVLHHVKRPEAAQVQLNVGLTPAAQNELDSLNEMLGDLATMQLKAIESGVPTREIAHQKLKRVEIVDAELIEEGQESPGQ